MINDTYVARLLVHYMIIYSNHIIQRLIELAKYNPFIFYGS